ncbi:armadillo-type fold protein, partial [Tanacetum coccineum]
LDVSSLNLGHILRWPGKGPEKVTGYAAEKVLSLVEQTPTFSMRDALKPSMKALIHDDLLRHSDVDVKVAVASCLTEIIRITAPDPPYDDDQMRVHNGFECYFKKFHIVYFFFFSF